MTLNTDRPTPRDLIEAPATKAVDPRDYMTVEQIARNLVDEFPAIPSDIRGLVRQEIAGALGHERRALEQARDEGRQEAVRQIRERVEPLTGGYPMEDGRPMGVGGDGYQTAKQDIARILDEVARHGRSSDPEPAPLPPCPICGKPDLFIGTDGRPGCPHCEVAVKLGAVPALQAAGEPLDVDAIEAALPNDFSPFWDEVQRIDGMTEATFNRRRFAAAIRERLGAGATGEGAGE